MDDCSSFNPDGRGKLIFNQGVATLGKFPLPSNRTTEQVFCDSSIFWCFHDNIDIPEGFQAPIEVAFFDLARRASNQEIALIGGGNLFGFTELFPLVVAECYQAIQTGESDLLLTNDRENIFPVIYGGSGAELLCALDRNVWTVAMRNHPSTAYDPGDRIFRPA